MVATTLASVGGIVGGVVTWGVGSYFCVLSKDKSFSFFTATPGALLSGTGAGLIGGSIAVLTGYSSYAPITGLAVGIFTMWHCVGAMSRF